MLGILYEEDVIDIINDSLDYTIEDEGIGGYEYGDGHYTDVDFQMRIADQSLVVKLPLHVEQYIPVVLTGTIDGIDDHETGEYTADYIAELAHVEWSTLTHCFLVTYEIRGN